MKRTRVLITTGVALIVLMVGLTLRDWRETMDLTRRETPGGPALVMEGIQAHGFDEQGAPDYWLRALAANRYEERPPRTLLAMPWLEIREGTQRWSMNARHGRMEGRNEHILLEDQVQGRRLSPGPPLELETEALRYRPDTGELVAPGPVLIRHQGGSTRAGSLRGRLPEGRFELLEGVETRYVPPS